MTVGFAKVSIKGEGDRWVCFFACPLSLPLWVADQVRNDGVGVC